MEQLRARPGATIPGERAAFQAPRRLWCEIVHCINLSGRTGTRQHGNDAVRVVEEQSG
jgi:hypothetical protein